MTERGFGIAHAVIAVANVTLVVVCAVCGVYVLNKGLTPLFFLDCALVVSNAYLAYYNFGEAKKLL